MSHRNAAPAACSQCTEELEAHLIGRNCLGGRLERPFRDHVLVFPEGEYSLKARYLGAQKQCELVVTASLRAVPPRLGTWWTSWTSPVDTHLDAGRLVAAEILQARHRFLAMLGEHGQPALPPVDVATPACGPAAP